MKKFGKRLICLAIMAVLVCSISVAAFALTLTEAKVGSSYRATITTMDSTEGMTFNYTGTVPPGLSISSDDTSIFISGTPTAAGEYSFNVTYELALGADRFDITLKVTEDIKSCSGSVTVNQGTNQSNIEVVDVGGMITDASLLSGSMPNGLKCDQYDTYFALNGTPTEAGTFTQKYRCEMEDGSKCDVTVTVVVTPSPTAAPTATPNASLPPVTPSPKPSTAPSTPTPKPSAAPKEIKITKNPGGETVTAGKDALFISSAENYSDVEWRIVPASGNPVWRNKAEIEKGFPGVKVETYKDKKGRECLSLSNIPASMDGYYIQTKFWSLDKSKTAFTKDKSCLLTVNEAALKQPSISSQPSSASKTLGDQVTLSVSASDPNGGTLSYQWYSSSNGSNTGGTKINGATSSTLTVPQTEGSTYYYATITSTKGGKTSSAVSSCACVTFAAPMPVETPIPLETPQPEMLLEPEVTLEPLTLPEAEPVYLPEAPEESGSSPLLIIILILAALVAAAAAVYYIIQSRKGDDTSRDGTSRHSEIGSHRRGGSHSRSGSHSENASHDEYISSGEYSGFNENNGYNENSGYAPAAQKGWICPVCGARNLTSFCPDCGERKPADALQYACDKCGWEPEDPSNPPHFCPNCGDIFGSEDIIR